MFHKYFEDYGYDSCTSRGVCSISPRMASIFEVIILYLKEFAYYSIKLSHLGQEDKNVKNLILNTLSAFVSNPELPDDVFAKVICTYSQELSSLKQKYILECEKQALTPEFINSEIDTEKGCDVIKSIRLGERKYLRTLNLNDKFAHSVQELVFFTAKSLAIYLIELNTLDRDSQSAFDMILELLDSLNVSDITQEDIKKLLFVAAEEEYLLIKQLAELREELFGERQVSEISFSSTDGKAILVDGTNLKELKEILDAVGDKAINVYTHGELISAHSYPKLREYNALKGHFGQGAGNSILDFSIFPGAVFVGRHSIDNIDNLYRGLIYTTDIIVPRGVVKIEDFDFRPLCDAALKSKGFKRGKRAESKVLNYSRTNIREIINDINFDKYEGVCIITQGNDYYTDRNYFEKLIKLLPDDILIINFSTLIQSENIINISAGYELYPIFEVVNLLKTKIDISEKPMVAFVPRCDKHITNLIINLLNLGVKKVFMGKCAAKNINPIVVEEFCNLFNVTKYENVKENYKTFIDELIL